MSDDSKRNGRLSLSTVALIVGIIGGPLAVWGDGQRDSGQTREKIFNIEKRQEEDRRDTRQNINEVKEHVKQIDQATQLILQKLTAMEAVQRAERRDKGR